MLAQEKAKYQRDIEIARGLLQTVLTNEDIAKHTSFRVEQVEQLPNEKQSKLRLTLYL